MSEGEQPTPRTGRGWTRSSILKRLVVAFLIVSLLPILALAALSLGEATSDPGAHEEGSQLAEGVGQHGTFLGVPIEYVELGVAGATLLLGLAAAQYVGRTIIRPLRSLESAMERVEAGDLDAAAAVTTSDEIGHLSGVFNRMLEGLRREAMVRDLFGQYVSPELARLAIEQQGQLAGQVVRCTVMFVDIRRFTALAEVLPPERLIGTLNRYFGQMLGEVEAQGGMVNKFGGDSMLAIFGSPLNPSDEHAARAVRAALAMRRALADFNRQQAAVEMPELQVGFGIATGDVVAGNVGSSRKLEYTVIGDPVNLAARLQELTTELGAEILLSSETARLVQHAARLRSLGEIEVRGRAQRVEVFAAEESFTEGHEAVDVTASQSSASGS